MAHQVKLEQFEGPLDLLLQLIEQEELDVTAIALATVCEQYLAHLKRVEQRPPEELADFLVVAAKLLYLKSVTLIPGAVVAPEDDATGLADQLRLYREFFEASKEIDRRLRSGAILYAAERAVTIERAFIPPPKLTADALRDVFVRILTELEPIVRIPRAIIGRVISIDDRIAEIRQLVIDRPHASFEDILRGRKSRQDAIVSFLAILELVKQQIVEVRQHGRFSSITISRAVRETEAIK